MNLGLGLYFCRLAIEAQGGGIWVEETNRAPMPKLLLPAAFCSANLIMYWGGFETNWKLALAIVAGLALFAIGAWRMRTGAWRAIGNAIWVGPWLGGQVLLGWLGSYGGGRSLLPNWVDVGVVIVFALAIFYWATALRLSQENSGLEVAKDAGQINHQVA